MKNPKIQSVVIRGIFLTKTYCATLSCISGVIWWDMITKNTTVFWAWLPAFVSMKYAGEFIDLIKFERDLKNQVIEEAKKRFNIKE